VDVTGHGAVMMETAYEHAQRQVSINHQTVATVFAIFKDATQLVLTRIVDSYQEQVHVVVNVVQAQTIPTT
tara:strand:- start:2311 stop:2523 length:213 start_codon:yes stop_codon:yes gene_type:complete